MSARRRFQSFTWIALWAFIGSFVLPVAGGHPVGDDDDGACLVGSWTTGDVQQMRAAAAGDTRPDHCVFCHWLRAMNSAEASDVVGLAAPASPGVLGSPGSRHVPRAELTAGSSRAPPSAAFV